VAESKRYRFVGSHADQLASGRPIAPGEFVDLTAEEAKDPYNAMLIADGNLVDPEGFAPDAPEPGSETKTSKGGSGS
jgi:hypothetical protein